MNKVLYLKTLSLTSTYNQCSVMHQFKGSLKKSSNKTYNICKKYNLNPLVYTMDRPKFIVSNHKEESISIQRVKKL